MSSTLNIITIHRFSTHSAAWEFFRACEAAGVCVGYPSLGPDASGFWTVKTAEVQS